MKENQYLMKNYSNLEASIDSMTWLMNAVIHIAGLKMNPIDEFLVKYVF